METTIFDFFVKTKFRVNFPLFLISVLIAGSFWGCHSARDAWNKAKTTDNDTAYLSVIIHHASSTYADSAFSALKANLFQLDDIEQQLNRFEKIRDTLSKGKFVDSVAFVIENLLKKRPLFIVLQDNKIGYINNTGKIIIKPQFKSGTDFNGYIALIQQDSLWGFINKKGKVLVTPQYKELCGFSEGLAAVKKGDKWGFIDTTGQFIITPKYSDAWPFSDSLALVELDNKWGFIDKAGKTRIDFKYKGGYYDENVSFELLINDTAGVVKLEELGMSLILETTQYIYADYNKVPAVKENYEWLRHSSQITYFGSFNSFGYTDKKEPYSVSYGNVESVDVFCGGLARLFTNDLWSFIDKTGTQVIKPQYKLCSRFSENLALVQKDDGIGFINRKGNLVIPAVYSGASDFKNGLSGVLKNGSWGYMDTTGVIVIKPEYDNCVSFNEGLALVTLKNKKGFIDKSGNQIIEPQYTDAYSFSEGLAAVRIDKKWGFIDHAGKIAIKPVYDEVFQFTNGVARVKINKKIGYINKEGKYIWEPSR